MQHIFTLCSMLQQLHLKQLMVGTLPLKLTTVQPVTQCNSLLEYKLNFTYPHVQQPHASGQRSEQVREEGPLEVCLVEDEAHKANHGNAA
jgi:hypothetical protein